MTTDHLTDLNAPAADAGTLDAPEQAVAQTARPQSLTGQAYRALEELIVTLQIEPGAAMSESALSDRLGIGRTPVREALQRLSREGLIEVKPRRGIRVTPIDMAKHIQLLELRRSLEQLLAEAAAERATPAERAEFGEIAEGMEVAAKRNDDVAFMRLDRQFNRLLCQAARNDYVTNAMTLIQGLSRRFWYSHYQSALDLPLCAQLHASVAWAVAEGRPARAVAAAERLIAYIESFARESDAQVKEGSQ